MAFGDFDQLLEQMRNELFPIIAIIPPTRWDKFKAWLMGREARTTVVRRIALFG